MARKVEKKAREPAPKGAGSSGAPGGATDELGILHPHGEIEVAGEVVTVREYGFLEGLQVQAAAPEFFAALYAAVPRDQAAPDFEQIQEVFVAHHEQVAQMIARAVDRDVEWVAGLPHGAGYRLMDAWWTVNVGFFIQLMFRRKGLRGARPQSAGPASTQPSSAPDTGAAPTTSGGSPPAS